MNVADKCEEKSPSFPKQVIHITKNKMRPWSHLILDITPLSSHASGQRMFWQTNYTPTPSRTPDHLLIGLIRIAFIWISSVKVFPVRTVSLYPETLRITAQVYCGKEIIETRVISPVLVKPGFWILHHLDSFRLGWMSCGERPADRKIDTRPVGAIQWC